MFFFLEERKYESQTDDLCQPFFEDDFIFFLFFFLLECRLLHLGLNDTHSFLTNRQVVVHHGGKRDHNDNNTWQNTVAVF